MKQFLDRRFSEWRGADRTKTIQDFGVYLGVEYGALEHWMSGRRNPKRENVARLAEKLGLEAYDAAGFARPRRDGDTQIPDRFVDDWKNLSPEQRQEFEQFFATITAEELLDFLRAAIAVRSRRGRGKRDDDGSGPGPGESNRGTHGGIGKGKTGLQQSAERI